MDLEESMASGAIIGTMALFSQATGRKIRYMGSVSTSGLTEEAMRANGVKTIWRDLEYTSGRTVVFTLGSTLMIKSMGMEFINGKTIGNMLGTGRMESSMVLEFTLS